MRDWTKTLRRASFRGVEFWVDDDELGGGKRMGIHEYADGRQPLLEEMGLSTSTFTATAYLLGDDSDVRAMRLVAAAQAAGPGRLVLPMDRGQMASIVDFRRVRAKDRMGFIAFDFTALPYSSEAGAVLGGADIASAVLNGLAAAARSFGSLF
ncbi:DNA circularization N-terminal domain-containing protein [Shinella zoogloeoides]|uniref:DNA circularization N-terminal domain-containing protein n=1 Tax=Shinella zoogloeoides TaxID=352475 RepID=UPI001F5837FE|nr:DNA circularization N-terminal domain-containing protein [Shinella zoogloeoides]